ncbi:hypothetical protein HYH02_012257 [Chlamydomonas schloesseri]|uniref:ATPase AAA-type core domain-containing protein n=1 Tax=Chlamydomonas schloesseri TaxID=2026947 RepID=A0A835VYX2_9CHLO|nr:hypothetical protein HYH02_012257 [Chlamydomonas schloesseri]|eukprot:KAG2434427.1 hypothetical protein HYH02_012257 [Chlamydomonas schloesseri]
MEEARSALQALSYKELQARAKALGIRANGASSVLLQNVAKAMMAGPATASAGSATPSAMPGSAYDGNAENATLKASAGPLLPTPPGTGGPLTPSAATTTSADCDPLTVAATATKRAAEAYAVARSELLGTPSLADLAAKASAAALAASLANLRLQSEMKPSVSRAAPASLLRARAQAQDAQGSLFMAAAPLPTTTASAALGAAGSFGEQRLTPKPPGLPGPVLEGLESVGADTGVGAAGEAPGSDFMSQLEQEEAQLEEAVRRLAFGGGTSPGPCGSSAATSAPTATVTLGDLAAATAAQQQCTPLTPTLVAGRSQAKAAASNSCRAGGASSGMEVADSQGAEGHGEADGVDSVAEAGQQQVVCRGASSPVPRPAGCGSSSCSPMDFALATGAQEHATPTGSYTSASTGTSVAALLARPDVPPLPKPPAAAATSGGAAAPAAAAASSSLSSGLLITDRTPARMQRMMGMAMVPPVSMAPMPTPQPAAQPVGALGSNGGVLGGLGLGGGALGLPRTPGTGLRTPARRVAVVGDEAQAQALDEWVRQNLLMPAPGAMATGDSGHGMSWNELVGLDDVKQQLLAICCASVEAPAATADARLGTSVPASRDSDASRRSSARVAAARRTPGRTPGRAVTSSSRSISSSASAAGAAASPSSASGSPTASTSTATAAAADGNGAGGNAVSRCARASHNLVVLLCGPQGAGKGLLARALAAHTGAAYLRLPGQLLADGAAAVPGAKPLPHGPGHTDALVRAVFRVATAQSTSTPGRDYDGADKVAARGTEGAGCPKAAAETPAATVVLHLDDIDQLVAMTEAAGRESAEGRRIRTELLVALDELLLQQQQERPATLGGSSNGACRPATGAPSFRLLVLATTSRPKVLDDGLALRLGANGCLLAAAPEADAREMFLVGRLAAEGAALGVEQIDRLVAQTDGFTCGSLAAVCDAATTASTRRGGAKSSHACGRKSGAAPTASSSNSAAGSRQSRGTPHKPAGGAKAGATTTSGPATAAPTPVEPSDLEAALQGLAGHRVTGEQAERMRVWQEQLLKRAYRA